MRTLLPAQTSTPMRTLLPAQTSTPMRNLLPAQTSTGYQQTPIVPVPFPMSVQPLSQLHQAGSTQPTQPVLLFASPQQLLLPSAHGTQTCSQPGQQGTANLISLCLLVDMSSILLYVISVINHC